MLQSSTAAAASLLQPAAAATAILSRLGRLHIWQRSEVIIIDALMFQYNHRLQGTTYDATLHPYTLRDRNRTMLAFASCLGCGGWLRRLGGTGMAAVADCLCRSFLAACGDGEGAEESELACMLSATSAWLA